MIEYTDQQFLYKAVPVDYDGGAKLKNIKGNSFVFNQLVNNGDFANGTSGWNGSIASSVSNNICTLTANSTSTNLNFNQMVSIPNGHTVLFKFDIKPSLNTPIMFNFYDGTNFNVTETFNATANTWYSYSKAITVTANIIQIYFRPNQTGTNGSTYQLRNVMLIDLTLMGITADQFNSYFPLPYYSYQSTLLPFKGTSIKTTGKNLFHNTAASATNQGITWTVNEDGSVTANGTCTNNVSVFRMYTPMLAKGSYFINGTPSGSAWGGSNPTWRIRLGHQDGSYINDVYAEGRAFTLTQDEILEIQCNIAVGKTVLNQMWFPMITFQGADSTFEPYTSSLTDLPISKYFPSGMKSARNAYDELLPNKAITRIGMVDLGTLNWNHNANYGMFTSGIANLINKPSSSTVVANITCANRVADTWSHVYNGGTSSGLCGVATDGSFGVSTTETNPTTFKSSLSGVYLCYELATPTETDADAEIIYRFYQYGTEEILPSALLNGVVDLGSLSWTYYSGSKIFESSVISGAKTPSGYNAIANILCAKYRTVSRGELWDNTNTIGIELNPSGYGEVGKLWVRDTSFTDANTFKSAMSNVYLYFEKTDSTPATAPIWCDIEYYNQIESETPYRKFWLVNGNGERWDLTEKELKSFLENPQGLGFQKTIDVTRYGERAYKNSESYNFPQVTGDVLFYDSANSTRYEKYNEFVRFLMEQPITLHYMIPVSYNSLIADTYSLECEVMSLTKTESKTDRILTSNIQMNGLGFYEGDEIEINGTANTLTINNKGDFPVGFEIELNGDFKNPYFTLEQNGELYGEAKFDDNANNFSCVFVNSKDGEQNVVLKQNNSIMPNPLAYQDLSISNGSIYVTFVKLAKGESTLTIGADSYTISGYTIRYTPIYRSV